MGVLPQEEHPPRLRNAAVSLMNLPWVVFVLPSKCSPLLYIGLEEALLGEFRME